MSTFAVLRCLVALTLLVVTEVKGECIVGDEIFQDGDEFTLPETHNCIKYRCSYDVYSMMDEGCEFKRKCYRVGSRFVYDCVTYQCVKTVNDATTTYAIKHVSTRCSDYNGMCKDEGDTFAYVINNRIHQKCTCMVTDDMSVAYRCSD